MQPVPSIKWKPNQNSALVTSTPYWYSYIKIVLVEPVPVPKPPSPGITKPVGNAVSSKYPGLFVKVL